jgi:hypothetical protein
LRGSDIRPLRARALPGAEGMDHRSGSFDGLMRRPMAERDQTTAGLLRAKIERRRRLWPRLLSTSAMSPIRPRIRDCCLERDAGTESAQLLRLLSRERTRDVSRIRANGPAAWATTSTTASPAKTAAPPRQTRRPLSPSPEQDWPLADHRRLCKQASGSRLVRWWTAAHQYRPAVIWSADRSFTLPVSDTCSHASWPR